MASGGENLIDEFEAAFQTCFSSILNQDHFNGVDSDETKTGVELSIQKFLDVAKQNEAWFIQKRMLLSVHKPEQIIMEETQDLKKELIRKEQLIQKHYEKLLQWQSMLRDGISGAQTSMPAGQQQQQQPHQPSTPAASQTPGGQQSQGQMYPHGPLAYLEQTMSNIR
ncbi:mediator of RNA polymerase II transcription subunit 28 [Lingula anatina]|uniref:Mediator of RNA polymerase II transcription subunit 28 n=1 Tax=Lingula anatina TaxID=7574 RepID=A0A1S3KEA8_LINAN|nr:mediator of RNA polymerase II transcription subunit 28 [Lingula anatina]|eukprot:XP_013420576.1 mediator of RNA polymerase II transcription subunit 28 [Lingula anatina]